MIDFFAGAENPDSPAPKYPLTKGTQPMFEAFLTLCARVQAAPHIQNKNGKSYAVVTLGHPAGPAEYALAHAFAADDPARAAILKLKPGQTCAITGLAVDKDGLPYIEAEQVTPLQRS